MSRPLPSRIIVSVGELALRGFPADQQRRIVRELESKLGGLLSDPQIAAELARGSARDGLKLTLATAPAPGGKPSVGKQAAAAIVQGLRR